MYQREQVREEWQRVGGLDQTAGNIMLAGLDLVVLDEPQLFTAPPEHLVTKGVQANYLREFIPVWLEQGVVGRLSLPTAPSHFSRMFTVPKPEGKRRPIIDLSPFNKRIRKQGFHMEDLLLIAKTIFPGLWGVKIDLKDAYFGVPLSPRIWKYFLFALGEGEDLEIFFFKVLPFGLTSAPWAFTRVMKAVKKVLRLRGIQVTSFLDDFLILARSYEEALAHTTVTIDLLQRLGFQINWEKSSTEPRRSLEYLGVTVDLASMTFSLPEEKVQKILSFCRDGLEASRLTRRELERLTGFFNFAAQYLRLGKLFLKPIVLWMNRNTSVALRDRYVLLDDSLREALIPWMDPDFLRCPIPIRRHPFSKTLMTDASLDAWSGILLPHSVRGPWPPEWEGMSMNWKELKAVHLSLIRFQNQLKGHCVRILSDSTTALACIRKEGSLASEALWDLAKDLLLFAQSKDISLYPVHLRGRLNVLADKASRDGLISTEWSLDRGSFKRICEVWGVPW